MLQPVMFDSVAVCVTGFPPYVEHSDELTSFPSTMQIAVRVFVALAEHVLE